LLLALVVKAEQVPPVPAPAFNPIKKKLRALLRQAGPDPEHSL